MTARVALYRGEDGVGIRRAIDELAASLGAAGAPLERWTVDASEGGAGAERAARLLDRVAERLATAPLFGGGTLVVVRQPANLLRDGVNRARLLRLVAEVPEGNGLACIEWVALTRRGGRVEETNGPLAAAIRAAGGEVLLFPAPGRRDMLRWLGERAAEVDVRLTPAAAQLLSERVGADLGEGDIDRRNQTELAWSGLLNLALLRPGGEVSEADVAALVPEMIPASSWAFLDAVGQRRVGEAAALAERLLGEGWPIQVLTSVLHRRLRELVIARDAADRHRPPAELVKLLATNPKRVPFVAKQAGFWTVAELGAALEGLLELDLASKGLAADGSTVASSDGRSALGLQAWLAERVARPSSTRPPPG
ncbi:MAG: DNA polymerase III subunit delta [Candidatus Limnocylindrales bacterium]